MATLYLGPELPQQLEQEEVVHCPLLRFVPQLEAAEETKRRWSTISHLLFTSKVAVRFALELLPSPLPHQTLIAVGSATRRRLIESGLHPHYTAQKETAEGMIDCIAPLLSRESLVCWPHSTLSRTVLSDWLTAHKIPHLAPALYDTQIDTQAKLPSLKGIDTIFFSSPSTVKAFAQLFGPPPQRIAIKAIGPITKAAVAEYALLWNNEASTTI